MIHLKVKVPAVSYEIIEDGEVKGSGEISEFTHTGSITDRYDNVATIDGTLGTIIVSRLIADIQCDHVPEPPVKAAASEIMDSFKKSTRITPQHVFTGMNDRTSDKEQVFKLVKEFGGEFEPRSAQG